MDTDSFDAFSFPGVNIYFHDCSAEADILRGNLELGWSKGGGGSGGGMTGRPGITALGKVTWVLGIAFVITSITLTVLASQCSKDSSVFDGIDPINASSVSDKIDASSSSEIDTSSPLTPPRADK